MLTSRTMDRIEETELVPAKKVAYQFSAGGHDLAQVVLGSLLDHRHDAAAGYYRSRPVLLALGLDLEDGLAGPLGRSGGYSDGRDIGVVCNLPGLNRPKMLPMAGGVGTQYTPALGWAQALRYRNRELNDASYAGAIAVALGGDGSVATNGFWAALNVATTQRLPLLFYIEDNAYGLSVPSTFQTPDGNIAANLASYRGLEIIEGDGTDPAEAADCITRAVTSVREGTGPVLCRLRVVRLAGHSAQDTQLYKSPEFVEEEKRRDPLGKLRRAMVPSLLSESEWSELEARAESEVRAALERAMARPEPDPAQVYRHVFTEYDSLGAPELQRVGGVWPDGHRFPESSETPEPDGSRINMSQAIRQTLDAELSTNPKLLLFGEDIGPKGGVHGVTQGLQERYGDGRVFDTSLSEEGIIGRAVGMAYAGLVPVAEIQFRKYADPAQEQLNDLGTVRWRTNNRFAAPVVVRLPGGYYRVGDPWHSQSDETSFAHAVGWNVAIPSNAEDAVGLLRAAMRGNDPTLFFEHRSLLDGRWARRVYPGDRFVIPFGKARKTRSGDAITVVSWGAMVERVEAAAERSGQSVEVLDLRTLVPWDRERVLESVDRTGRCLVVHEDVWTAGFGAEVASVCATECFLTLRAPVDRLAVRDIPLPYNPMLLQTVLPSVEEIAAKIVELVEFD
ncbi:MAG: transketolase C-terminal domain-containing protein [Myxococcota bacterium]